jgi:hypothetical protein
MGEPVSAPLFTCPEKSRGWPGYPCTEPVGHDGAHSHHDEQGRWISTWVDREQFEAAKARGEFDHHYCRCDEPEPGDCLSCGGEIL